MKKIILNTVILLIASTSWALNDKDHGDIYVPKGKLVSLPRDGRTDALNFSPESASIATISGGSVKGIKPGKTKVNGKDSLGNVCESWTVYVWDIEVKEKDNILDLSNTNEPKYVYINATPEMPEMKFKLDVGGESVSESVSWELNITYNRSNRNDSNNFSDNRSASSEWKPTLTFCGGKANIKATFEKENLEKEFHIRGYNPSAATISSEIGNSPYYALAIAKKESSLKQFNDIGRLGSNSDDIKNCPNRSNDGIGWGLYQQSNPAPNVTQLWNWKNNISDAKQRMSGHRTTAINWINRQIQQQKEDEPTKPLSNESFIWNGVSFKDSTARTPVDACAILIFNGTGYNNIDGAGNSGHAISWIRKTSTSPGYWNKRTVTHYLNAICGLL